MQRGHAALLFWAVSGCKFETFPFDTLSFDTLLSLGLVETFALGANEHGMQCQIYMYITKTKATRLQRAEKHWLLCTINICHLFTLLTLLHGLALRRQRLPLRNEL